MFSFVKVRKTKLNLSLAKEGDEEAFDEDQYEQNKEDENSEDESNEGYNDADQYEANELENSLQKKPGRNCSDNIRNLVIISVWWE